VTPADLSAQASAFAGLEGITGHANAQVVIASQGGTCFSERRRPQAITMPAPAPGGRPRPSPPLPRLDRIRAAHPGAALGAVGLGLSACPGVARNPGTHGHGGATQAFTKRLLRCDQCFEPDGLACRGRE